MPRYGLTAECQCSYRTTDEAGSWRCTNVHEVVYEDEDGVGSMDWAGGWFYLGRGSWLCPRHADDIFATE